MKIWTNAKQFTTRIAASIMGGAVRRFAGAANSRLLADWIMACISPNDDIRQGLVPLRNRARDLEQNNSYINRYLTILETEVVGSEGMTMQNRAVRYRKLPDGEFEAMPLNVANSIVEKEWTDWGKKGNCTVCGRFSFAQVQQKVLRWTARDGDMAIIIRRGAAYGKWGIQLQLLRGDYLDDTYTVPYRDGKRIDMGIERNADGRAVAYHFFTGDPNDTYAIKRERTRVAAEDVIYMANPKNPDEPRSVTWLHAIMIKLKMLDGGTEAELVAMRAEACKVFAWEDLNANANAGGDERKTNAPTNEQLSPGQSVYRPGKKLTSHSPAHPNGNFPGFYNCILHEIAAGLMISFSTLAGNLEKVNMSSIRAGLLLERAYYTMLQRWLQTDLCTPVFAVWFEQAIMARRLPFSVSEIDTYCQPEWHGRRWPWVDPLKDLAAYLGMRRAGWMSDSMIMAAMGNDFEAVRRSIKRDAKFDEANGTTPAEDAFRSLLTAIDDPETDPQELQQLLRNHIKELAA